MNRFALNHIRLISACIVGLAAGLLVAGLAPSMGVLVIGRGIQGLGSGAVSTVAYVAIGRGYSDRLQPRMFAVLAGAWVVPGLVGPAAAGAVAQHFGWRLVFLGLLPFLPLLTLLTFPVLRTLGPNAANPTASHTGAAVVLAFATGSMLFGLASSEPFVIVPLVIAGGAASIASLRRLLPAGTFRAGAGLPAVVATAGLTNMAFGGAEAFLPFALTEIRGLSPSRAGLALTAAVLSWTAGTQIQSRRAHRWSPRSLATAGLLFVIAGIGSSAAILVEDVPVFVAAFTWALSGFGMGLTIPTISLATLAEGGDDALGAASASMNLATVLGLAVGTGLGGALVSAGETAGWEPPVSVAAVFGLMLGLGAVALVTALRMPRASTARETATTSEGAATA